MMFSNIYKKGWKVLSLMGLSLFVTTAAYSQYSSQTAYHPNSVKRVFLDEHFSGKDFMILSEEGDFVIEGKVSKAKFWPESGTKTGFADFSEVTQEGSYQVVVGDELLAKVDIDNGQYKKLGKSLLKSFYFARASFELKEAYAGEYARLAGHPDDEVIIHSSAADKNRKEGMIISSPGGWYDAGDYNKYMVNSGISTYTLFHLYDLYEYYFRDIYLNIPESGNGISDLLDETLYNFRWMLSMQDPNDGGVYHKLTSKRFSGMMMPHEDDLKRYVVMKTTSATLDFAATAAKAYRILKDLDGGEMPDAPSVLQQAENAWEWAMKNPEVLYVQPDDIKTGQYKDKELGDEWFWAAAELFAATGEEKYRDFLKKSTVKFSLPQWGRVSTLGLFSLSMQDGMNTPESTVNVERPLLDMADRFLNIYKKSAYKVPLARFPWGSNGELSNIGILFIHAYLLSENTEYLEAADACVGYLMGANPLGQCFVTGFGDKSPVNIHDRRSHADEIAEPIPGLLVGGPTMQARKDCGPENYPGTYPALSYLDEECSYSTNEVAINWNAPAVFLVLALDAIYSKAKQ
ncbi:glycoside hydrolase family 9 protein [Marinilabilia rubra]|uniref:Endoglucanase n=1 Tax=Marinilabilia rubra TaxID=2162893 RepID=A0A2U2B428_9BACT|nr:glycoside hydrolase family 9 protein [Marinilabilia rubra]PWD97816.1 cellulase [Marinilabilia rubra]